MFINNIWLREKFLFYCDKIRFRLVRTLRLFYRLISRAFNTLKAKLNPICHLLPLLGAHHILHVSRIKVNVDYTQFFFMFMEPCILVYSIMII